MGDYTRAASLPNVKREISVQHAASSQFKRVSIYLKRFSSTILQKCVLSHDKGSYTDFSTVHTFSKDAQIVGDFLEELDAVTTFYVAIFIQAKEIQMTFSEEFSNTVVRLEDYTAHSTSCLCWVRSFVFMYLLLEIFLSLV